MSKKILKLLTGIAVAGVLGACSATKFVPDGSYLLDEVRIRTDNKEVAPSNLRLYVRQNPNARWFSLFKTQLYIYDLSGRDSTKWMNRFLRRIGDAPVIYNAEEAERTRVEMNKAVQNMGFMGSSVSYTTRVRRKKLSLRYDVKTGPPYIVRSFSDEIGDARIADILQADSAKSLLRTGMRFDVNVLDADRQRVTNELQNVGYYRFNKDYIGYTADTVRGTYRVDLTRRLYPYRPTSADSARAHSTYRIGNIYFIMDYDVMQSSALSSIYINDSVHYRGYPIYYRDKLYLRPKLLTDNLRFRGGELYNADAVQQTYSRFGRLSALKYTNIRFVEKQVGDSTLLDSYVLFTKGKPRSVTFEVEGTNSAGDLGAAASVSFQNRNFFRGSEIFMVKLRGAYEVISGLQAGYSNSNYTEWGVETSVNFPNFLFPFLSSDFKRRVRATTEFALLYNYQVRPEFQRTLATASWSYRWSKQPKIQHRVDLMNISFLYYPTISERFKQDYLNKGQNQIFLYNYQDRLIINMGYNYYYNSVGSGIVNNTIASNSYSLRFNFESAGNLMYALSKAANIRKNANGEYAILGLPFYQYLKAEFDYAQNVSIDHRNSVAFHVGVGVAVPYGNARNIPFEKQYFAGGANSVRGWTVRGLGPGAYSGPSNLFDRSGDIKLDASIEYRSKLFWKFQGAAFVDAGNIWTIRSYDNLPDGVFKFNRFYKQIAVAYGLGLRMDFDFFILRFDAGMKAINPVYTNNKEHYPIVHPRFKRDFAFHFAVGYPF
ncbi:MAG: BamA/TamA family outer membrane protein [Mediterranea sp.]|jgi:outer membrane protein assembly factor BamA|nr:BamA/TamA family outer membrane protein [Mediterranea sp.]